MWNLSSLTRVETYAPCMESRVLTTGSPGESLVYNFKMNKSHKRDSDKGDSGQRGFMEENGN